MCDIYINLLHKLSIFILDCGKVIFKQWGVKIMTKKEYIRPNKNYDFNNETGVDYFCFDSYRMCPFCTKLSIQTVEYLVVSLEDSISILFTCGLCNRCNFGIFKTVSSEIEHTEFSIDHIHNIEQINSFPFSTCPLEDLNNLSFDLNEFQSIWTQSKNAKEIGLDEIAGMGFRKALDCLVRAYACSKNPDSISKINDPRQNLGSVIGTHILNEDIKTLAKASSYLGNDHAHIFKKFPENDVDDLANLIESLLGLIISENLREESLKLAKNINSKPK